MQVFHQQDIDKIYTELQNKGINDLCIQGVAEDLEDTNLGFEFDTFEECLDHFKSIVIDRFMKNVFEKQVQIIEEIS